ncbi:MAG: RNA polymerase sigma factor [Fimbriimonadales bacterium]
MDKIFAKCRIGDQAAWSALVQKYQNLVYSIPTRMRLGREDCADVFQTTFVALAANIDRIEQAAALPKWLSVTASREALRIKRIAGSHQTVSESDKLSLDEVVASEERSAEASAIDAVEAEVVRSAVGGMDKKCRELLSLLFFENDVAYSEVSERTGMPVGAIGPTRSRCLDKLRKTLADNDFF